MEQKITQKITNEKNSFRKESKNTFKTCKFQIYKPIWLRFECYKEGHVYFCMFQTKFYF